MNQRQHANDASVGEIPIDIPDTQSGEIDPGDVPTEIESITHGLASEQPPTSPLVVLKAVQWWYIHGKGGSGPAFRWTIEWTRHLTTGTSGGVEMFDGYLKYLIAVGFADEPHEFR